MDDKLNENLNRAEEELRRLSAAKKLRTDTQEQSELLENLLGGVKDDAKTGGDGEQLALDDDRRVKTLSPMALVLRRFSRNRLAIFGTIIIVLMFLFSFLGGVISPYDESELFMRVEQRVTDWAFASVSTGVQIVMRDSASALPVSVRSAVSEAIRAGETEASAGDAVYYIEPYGNAWIIKGQTQIATGRRIGNNYLWEGDIAEDLGLLLNEALENEAYQVEFEENTYAITQSGRTYSVSLLGDIALASQFVVNPLNSTFKSNYEFMLNVIDSISNGGEDTENTIETRSLGGVYESYAVSEGGEEVCILSQISIQPRRSGEYISPEVWAAIRDAIEGGVEEFDFAGVEYVISLYAGQYNIKTEQDITVVSTFERPSAAHWLGTDFNGMDVVTRLMYGGRVSLMIGFVVIIIGAFLGVVLGGVAGYFGKGIDMLIMRAADVFNCIPTLPLYLIFGSIMEGNRVEPRLRIYYLMIVMGVMSWSGIARIVRGQILSLREQEFMMAAEALGIRTSRRIFRHLVPNVIPQLIVWATMGLGDVIIAESTLSFLGLGVKYPMASWGNILNSVNDMHIMVNFLNVWIPAGLLILVTVLGFNFIGDGLRDAFDPKTKR